MKVFHMEAAMYGEDDVEGKSLKSAFGPTTAKSSKAQTIVPSFSLKTTD